MSTANVNGISVNYQIHGSGPVLVFIHGFGGNLLSWWQQIPKFSKYFTCLTYDQRSFGSTSDDIDNPRGKSEFANDLEALLDYLKIDSCSIVAHSMGARAAVGFSLRNAGRVKGLVISSANGGCDNQESRAVRKFHKNNPPDLPNGMMRSLSVDFHETEPQKSFLHRQIMRLNPKHPSDFLKVPAHLIGCSTHEKLGALGIPIIFIVGMKDTLVAPRTIEIAASLVSGAELFRMHNVGHSTYYEAPETFNSIVLDFLNKKVYY